MYNSFCASGNPSWNEPQKLDMQLWRNWQTRTFEGRVGNRMGSSPISCTSNEKDTFRCPFLLLFLKGLEGRGETVRGTVSPATGFRAKHREKNGVFRQGAIARKKSHQHYFIISCTTPNRVSVFFYHLSFFFKYISFFVTDSFKKSKQVHNVQYQRSYRKSKRKTHYVSV